MTREKLLAIISSYRILFETLYIKKLEYPTFQSNPSWRQSLEHCHWMLDDLQKFVEEGKTDKACRWLGFIQGVVWAFGLRSINDLRDLNRAD